jgi:hypothetical protein
MTHTDEDDEFDRILRENRIRGQAYHFPEQPKWTGLTDAEILDCWTSATDNNVYTKKNVYNAIEAKLREKNT